MNATQLSQALSLGSQTLAVIVSVVGLIIAVSQWTRPARLGRREKWLREAVAVEKNERRHSVLSAMLTDTTAQLVAGIKVPGWRFIGLALWMLLGPIQAFVTARNDPSVVTVVQAIALSLVLTATPIRMGIRLLAERYRVAYEYGEGLELNPVRVGTLNLTEGGTRREFTQAILLSAAINVLAIAVSLIALEQTITGVVVGIAALGGIAATAGVANSYARSRASIYGPWSVTNPRL